MRSTSTRCPTPGGRASEQSRQDRVRGEQPGEDVDDGHAHLGGLLAALRPRDGHEPADRLHDEVVAKSRGPGADRSETGHRAIDQSRVHFRQFLVGHPEALHRPRLEVLDEHVGSFGEPACGLAARGGRESRATLRLLRFTAR